jgi:hypothetical protein
MANFPATRVVEGTYGVSARRVGDLGVEPIEARVIHAVGAIAEAAGRQDGGCQQFQPLGGHDDIGQPPREVVVAPHSLPDPVRTDLAQDGPHHRAARGCRLIEVEVVEELPKAVER